MSFISINTIYYRYYILFIKKRAQVKFMFFTDILNFDLPNLSNVEVDL